MLQNFGFSQYESQVYEILANSNEPLDATRIVKYSGVPKSKVYEVLTRLIDKGMILNTVSGRKKLYAALPLSVVIEKLTAEFQSNIDKLKVDLTKKSFMDERVWSLKESSAIRAQCKQLIQEAAESVRISAWNDDFVEYCTLLKEKEEEGVKIEAIVVGNIDSTLCNQQTIIPNSNHKTLERYQLVITDDRRIMFAAIEGDSWQAIDRKSVV